MEMNLKQTWPPSGKNWIESMEAELCRIRKDVLHYFKTSSPEAAAETCERLSAKIQDFLGTADPYLAMHIGSHVIKQGLEIGGGWCEEVVLKLGDGRRQRFFIGAPPENRWNRACLLALHGTHENAEYFLNLLKERPRNGHEGAVGFCLPFLRRGYMVVCPDLPCFGEDNPIPDLYSEAYSDYIFQVDILSRITGVSYLGEAVRRLTAVTDYLHKRFSGLCSYAAVGFSLGGMTALALAACDNRIQAVIEYMGIGTLERENDPRTQLKSRNSYGSGFSAEVGDHWTLPLACAPRPFLRYVNMDDPINSAVGAEDIKEILLAAYGAFGATDNFCQREGTGGHGLESYMAEDGVLWLDETLRR